jgi:hypothetical protein
MVRIINGQPLLRRPTDTLSWDALGNCVSLSLGILHQYPAWQLQDYYDMKRLNTDLIYIMAQCRFYKILIYAICLRNDIAKLLLKLAWSPSQISQAFFIFHAFNYKLIYTSRFSHNILHARVVSTNNRCHARSMRY